MRTNATRGLLAAALMASTVATIGVSSASPAAAACGTWQYEIKAKTGAYDEAGHWQATAWSGYKLNTNDPQDYVFTSTDGEIVSGPVKKGRLYDTSGARVVPGDVSVVRKVMLDYVTCW